MFLNHFLFVLCVHAFSIQTKHTNVHSIHTLPFTLIVYIHIHRLTSVLQHKPYNKENNPENKPHNNFVFSTPYDSCHLRACVCVCFCGIPHAMYILHRLMLNHINSFIILKHHLTTLNGIKLWKF